MNKMIKPLAAAFFLATAFSVQTVWAEYTFRMELGTDLSVSFATCTDIGSVSDTVEQGQVGSDGSQIVRYAPGPLSWTEVSCTRPLIDESLVKVWQYSTSASGIRFNFSLQLNYLADASITPVAVAKWLFEKAWVSKYAIYTDENNRTMEKLTFIHEYVVRVQ